MKPLTFQELEAIERQHLARHGEVPQLIALAPATRAELLAHAGVPRRGGYHAIASVFGVPVLADPDVLPGTVEIRYRVERARLVHVARMDRILEEALEHYRAHLAQWAKPNLSLLEHLFPGAWAPCSWCGAPVDPTTGTYGCANCHGEGPE